MMHHLQLWQFRLSIGGTGLGNPSHWVSLERVTPSWRSAEGVQHYSVKVLLRIQRGMPNVTYANLHPRWRWRIA